MGRQKPAVDSSLREWGGSDQALAGDSLGESLSQAPISKPQPPRTFPEAPKLLTSKQRWFVSSLPNCFAHRA